MAQEFWGGMPTKKYVSDSAKQHVDSVIELKDDWSNLSTRDKVEYLADNKVFSEADLIELKLNQLDM